MVRILHAVWSIKLGENRPDQSSQAFGDYVPQSIMMTVLRLAYQNPNLRSEAFNYVLENKLLIGI